MARAPRHERIIAYSLLTLLRPIRMRWATAVYIFFLRRWGAHLTGRPAYISGKVYIDGTDYSLVTLGEGVTISSYVRILTHDWAPHTIGKSMGVHTAKPLGRLQPVAIGDYSFVGAGSIVMPGTRIGKGCLIGSGTVVRGNIPDYSIVIGNPGQIISDSRDYMATKFPEHAETISGHRAGG